MISNIIKGMLIGGANVIPGLSGGTVAFILGIYSYLTEAIGNFFICSWDDKKKYFKFLMEISGGVILGIIILAKIIMFFYGNFKEESNFFFIGLVIISLKIILEENKEKLVNKSKVSIFIGFIFIIFISYFINGNTSNANQNLLSQSHYIKLYFSGLLAGASMIVPGLSGSLILIILGEYENILNFINEREIIPLIFLGLGCIFGILLISKIIDFLLKNHKNIFIYFLIGMIGASIFSMIPNYESLFKISNIVSALFGISLVLFLKKYKNRREDEIIW